VVVSSFPSTHLFFTKKFSLFWYFLALLVAQQYLNEILSFVVFVFEMIEQDSCIEVECLVDERTLGMTFRVRFSSGQYLLSH
jgi:hypothetical protein